MNREPDNLSSCKKCLFILCVLVLAALTGLVPVKAKEATTHEQWREWVGKRVDVNYACCGESACVQIQGARLKVVKEKHIVVITKGSPLLIPSYLIKAVRLSK
ncbi:MAG: hypothetical protein JRJ82_21835 [Deltaproteobacteria bacterium]|nr:hypothetical protein [Deltaproteobacteria bacterium]